MNRVKQIKTTFLMGLFLLLSQLLSAQTHEFDTARIYKAMNKGRNGDTIRIGVLGGSITAGYAASSESKRWANIVANWWKIKFPNSKVELINAGWGGTGSDIGTHRAYDDLLSKKPDFVVVEFSVNDAKGDLATKMMEGLIQQILVADNNPGVMMLLLKQDNGTTAAESHKPVAIHYGVPMANFADSIDAKLIEDGVTLSSLFVDGLHPNDKGMAYVAGFITEILDSIYVKLPPEGQLPIINTELPAPLVTSIFSKTFQYFPKNIVPFSNQGWVTTSTGWNTASVNSQIEFKVMGNAVSLVFTQNNSGDRGRAEVWVDDHAKTIIDAYMTDDWGTKYAYALVQEGLADGEHTLHIKVISESSTSGNYVHIERVMVAGNVGSAAPIAKTSSYQKGVVGYNVELDGSESFDPDDEPIESFKWTITEKPVGSTVNITKATESKANFTPDVAGDYIISLEVGAGINTSVPANKKVSIRASNAKPVAVPGNDTVSALNKYFRFDGTKSYDADGDILSFSWKLESKPESSKAVLMKPDSNKPQIKFDVEGEYVVSLITSDSIDFSEKGFIKVEGRDGYTAITELDQNLEWVDVYPNPAVNQVTIKYFLQKPESVHVKMFTLEGKHITSINYSQNVSGINEKTIDLTALHIQPGLYVLTISSDSYSKIIRAIII